MLTPIEIQGKVFKSGIGYDKKDVEAYMRELVKNYEALYRENVELSDKLNVLSEGIQYYKTIEKTLQKALVVAQKTAQDTEASARIKAEAIEADAKAKAKGMLYDAKKEYDRIQFDTINLIQQYEKYKAQYKQLAAAQLEFLDSGAFSIQYTEKDIMKLIGIEETDSSEESQQEELGEVAATKEMATMQEKSVEKEEPVITSIKDIVEPETMKAFDQFVEQESEESTSSDEILAASKDRISGLLKEVTQQEASAEPEKEELSDEELLMKLLASDTSSVSSKQSNESVKSGFQFFDAED